MLPEWLYNLPWELIREKAHDFGLDPLLVASIIMVESSGNPWGFRFEPEFKWVQKETSIIAFAKINGITPETERISEMCSFGMMQVMGSTVRDLGWRGPLVEMFSEELGIEYGVKYLARKMDRYDGDVKSAVAAYNAGSAKKNKNGTFENQEYVDKVYSYLRPLMEF